MPFNQSSTIAIDVEVRGLTKRYGGQAVFENLNFTVQAGEIFVIMGPSGAGKTVLLKQIIGLEEPDAGQILLAGQDARLPSTHEQIVSGIVFQSGALFNSMTVFDNLALYLRERLRLPKAEIQQRVEEALSTLSLENALHKFPAELSGGMKKRVAVARTLVMRPRLLLYDEPTSELDPILSATVAELIATVRRQTRLTSIVVSHDRDLALTIGDRVAVLMDGKIVCCDTPSQVRACRDPRVVEFLNPVIDLENPRFRKELIP